MDIELTDAQTDVLIDVLLDSPDMDVFLQRLVQISSQKLGQSQAGPHCSVTVIRNRRPVTVSSSDPETAALDEVQYASKRGPCMEAALKGQLVEVVDLRTETRWARYVTAMTGSPMRSVLAVPIPLKTAGGSRAQHLQPSSGPGSRRPEECPGEVRNSRGPGTDAQSEAADAGGGVRGPCSGFGVADSH
ncbi:hypothetical protein QF031_002069 [Pseudarthrobacter defluvii]|nr:hypothetical protein [Pseudarthrobacter defluvii]